jgi:hypothetical protein
MMQEEFTAYLDSLPPEVRAAAFDALKPIGAYAARAIEVRAWVAKEFPAISPPIRAILSLTLAGFR